MKSRSLVPEPIDEELERARIVYEAMTSKRLVTKPSDLYRFLYALTNEMVPFEPCCKEHKTPWHMIWDSFKVDFPEYKGQGGMDIIAIGPREGYKTLSTAKLNAIELLLKPKIEIASVGAIIKQAARCYKFTSKYLFHPVLAEMQAVLKSTMEETTLSNGSRYEQLVGSFTGVNCLGGDTWIERIGPIARTRICDLVGKKNLWLFAWDEDKRCFVMDQMKRCWKVGRAKVYEVMLDNCVTIRATSDHPFWVRGKGWIKTMDLCSGDSVEPLHRNLLKGKGERFYWDVRKGPGYPTMREARWVMEQVLGKRLKTRDHVHHHGKPYDNRPGRIQKLDISEHAKLTCYESSLREGWDQKQKEKASKAWATRRSGESGKSHFRIRREKLDDDRIVRLYQDGLLSPGAIAKALGTTPRRVQSVIYRRLPGMVRDQSESSALKPLAANHKILTVREAGWDDVYDIEMEKHHSFVANGIVVHNSPHPNKLRADEVELMKPEVVEEMKMVSSSYNSWRAHAVYTSTRKFVDGNMSELLRKSAKEGRHTKTMVWCYKDVSEPCPDDRSGVNPRTYEVEDIFHHGETIIVQAYEYCGDCALLPSCRGDLKRAKGNLPIDDAIKKWNELDRDTWLAQKECVEPPRTSLFYYDWDDKLNVNDVEYKPGTPVDMFFDFTGGGEDPTVCQLWQTVEGIDYLFKEMVYRHRSTGQVGEEIENICRSLHVRPERMMGDSSQMQQIRDLRAFSTFFNPLRPVRKVERKIGMSMCRRRLRDNNGKRWTIVDRRCINFIQEIRNYKRRASDPDDARDGNDHSMDCWRYRTVAVYYHVGEPRVRLLSLDDGEQDGSSGDETQSNADAQKQKAIGSTNPEVNIYDHIDRVLRDED